MARLTHFEPHYALFCMHLLLHPSSTTMLLRKTITLKTILVSIFAVVWSDTFPPLQSSWRKYNAYNLVWKNGSVHYIFRQILLGLTSAPELEDSEHSSNLISSCYWDLQELWKNMDIYSSFFLQKKRKIGNPISFPARQLTPFPRHSHQIWHSCKRLSCGHSGIFPPGMVFN